MERRVILCLVVPVALMLTHLHAAGADEQQGDGTPQLYCVRPGATGDASGQDWDNAYPALPDELVRSATYYLADGAYAGREFNTPESGQRVITIRKATGTEHGTDVGWEAAFGDGVATFHSDERSGLGGQVCFATGYWTFDGAVGSGTAGHGFRIPWARAKLLRVGTQTFAPSHVTIRHVDVSGRGHVLGPDDHTCCFYSLGARYLTISHCYFHDAQIPMIVRRLEDSTIEYTHMARNKSTPTAHSEAISSGGGKRNVVRYCTFEDIMGTGIIMVSSADGWDIYGNVFFNTLSSGDEVVVKGGMPTGHGAVSCGERYPSKNIRVHNNTMVRLRGIRSGILLLGGERTGNVAYNNLWYDCVYPDFQGVDHDYNWFCKTEMRGIQEPHMQPGSDDPFVAIAVGNFRLRSPTESGKADLGAPFGKDRDGRPRGADGAWDRGAFEFQDKSANQGTSP